MNRRKFLQFLGVGTAAGAAIVAEQTIPLNRVWSFPKKIIIPKLTMEQIRDRTLVELATARQYQLMYCIQKDGLYVVENGKVKRIAPPEYVAQLTEHAKQLVWAKPKELNSNNVLDFDRIPAKILNMMWKQQDETSFALNGFYYYDGLKEDKDV